MASVSLLSETVAVSVALGTSLPANTSGGSLKRTSKIAFVAPRSPGTMVKFAFGSLKISLPSAVAVTVARASVIGPPAVRDTSTRACTVSFAP